MRFDTSQHMQLGQQMKLAPRMIQSMEILQMPMLALQERIDQELESNIALEQVEPGMTNEQLEADRRQAERDDTVGERELVVGEDSPTGAEDFERLDALETTYSEAFDNEYSSQRYSASRMAGERDRKMDAMANVAARSDSLTDQLLHQWAMVEVAPDIAVLGARIIPYIDDDGLLRTDLETILDQNRNLQEIPELQDEPVTVERLADVMQVIQQTLEPAGIGARDQRESLLIQVDRREADPENEHDWTDVRELIEHHFEDLLQNRLPRIAQQSKISLEGIQEAMQLMRRLNLSPGRDLVDEKLPHIVPDVFVEYDEENDEYVAALSSGVLPTLRVSPRYRTMAKDRTVEKETRDFVGRGVRNATWLIDAISQRRNTLLRVVNVVLARQREFFDHGPQHLKPLPMIEVADQLGIHVGTVSRAVSEKWLQTPRGLVPLRKFFSGGTETASGKDMSWEAIKATLKEVIDQEDKSSPYSDEALARELKARGIDIARRTVVKYRSQLNIPSARQRKVYATG